jgi:hypothetical protein
MPTLDIQEALGFLDMLDPGRRHTLASEAPFGPMDFQNGRRARPMRRANGLGLSRISRRAKLAGPMSTTASTAPVLLVSRRASMASAMWTT